MMCQNCLLTNGTKGTEDKVKMGESLNKLIAESGK